MTEVEARKLAPGNRIAGRRLPLGGDAVVLFVKVYTAHSQERVFVVYEYTDVETHGGQPTPDDFLPDTLIPVVPSCPDCGRTSHGFMCTSVQDHPAEAALPRDEPRTGFTLFGVPMHDMPEPVRAEVGKILTEAVRDSPGAEARFHQLFEIVHGRHRDHDCDPYHCTAP